MLTYSVPTIKKKKTKLIEVSKLFKKPLHILTNANDLDVIGGVAKLLNESTTSLIHTVEDINEQLPMREEFPSIVSVHPCEEEEVFFIFAENTCLTSGTDNIISAFQHLLVVYFVYFYKYPKEVSKILEFLQIFLMKVNPAYGSRSSATIVGGHQRMVSSLIGKITKMNWQKMHADH